MGDGHKWGGRRVCSLVPELTFIKRKNSLVNCLYKKYILERAGGAKYLWPGGKEKRKGIASRIEDQ